MNAVARAQITIQIITLLQTYKNRLPQNAIGSYDIHFPNLEQTMDFVNLCGVWWLYVGCRINKNVRVALLSNPQDLIIGGKMA